MDRSKFVRRFKHDNNIYCLICEGLLTDRKFGECPVRDICLCSYIDASSTRERIIIISKNIKDKLFDNTNDTIISTIFDCGDTIEKCQRERHSGTTCERCNFTIAKNEYMNGNYQEN